MFNKRTVSRCVWLALVGFAVSACGSSGSDDSDNDNGGSNTVNSAPTVDAGTDQSVGAGDAVELLASASDPDSDPLAITWSLVSNGTITLQGADTLTPSFTAPPVQQTTEFEFQISVSDGSNPAVTDNVVVTVSPATTNASPVVSASAENQVNAGDSVSLTASATDADGDTLSYVWRQVSGTQVSLTSSNSANASFTAPQLSTNETLVFEVSVSDGVNDAVTQQLNITVLAAGNSGGNDDLVQTHLNSWIVNEQGTTSTYINGIEENVQSAELVSVADGSGNDVEYIYVEATGVAGYEFEITQEQIDELNARPNANTEFSSGATTAEAGDTIKFGQDMGFRVRGTICQDTGGEGFWPPGLQCPENVEHQAYFAAEPTAVENDEELCETGLGTIGLMVNGTSIFDWGDGMSYGDGVWYNLAPVFEEYDVDVCGGHSANGEYHHHFYSSCLAHLLDDDGDEHSPIYGFAADGYPVYGPYESDGELAVSGWVARDYGAATTQGGCNTPGERSCVLVDQYDLSKGVETVSAGPDIGEEVTSQSGNPIPAVSGVYFEDYYYAGATVSGAQLDQHNGHDVGDGKGYHYHITLVEDENGKLTPAFPYQIGPKFKGEIPDNAVRSCAGGSGNGGGPGGPGGAPGG